MLSIREIQSRTVSFFKSKGVPNAKLDTDLLISHVLGVARLELYLDLERPLTDTELDVLRPLVRRRANREPLQYLLGSVEFCEVDLKVDSRALIPRPETEELFELVTGRLDVAPKRILDLGTGTGALSLSLAKHYSEARVTAVDLSEAALSLAQENAARNQLIERVRFLAGSWFEPIPKGELFDLIVANPPYLTEREMTTAEPEVVDYEPHMALVSGADGLDDLRCIFAGAAEYLAEGGLMAFEVGIAQGPELLRLVGELGFHGEMLEDLSTRPRFFVCGRSNQA